MDHLPPIFVTVNETKRLLSLGHTKVYELIKSGALEHVKSGSKTLIVYASVVSYAESLRG